jgi:hypothetical protein
MIGNRWAVRVPEDGETPRRQMRILTSTAMKAVAAGLALAAAFACACATAQERTPRPNRRPPLRIEIVPRQFYRQCVDWHEIEHRPTGDVIVPRQRCRWALH